MRYLFAHWDSIREKLKKARHRLLLFDFDGTLAGLAQTPKKARLEPGIRRLLAQLTRRKTCAVGIISGRSLKEIESRVGLPRVAYVGNHGLESQNGRGKWVHPEARQKKAVLHAFALHLRAALRGIPGIFIEDKGVTLSVHFRRVQHDRRARAHRIVRRAFAARGLGSGFRLERGKQVLEIQPYLNWGKGTAVEILWERSPENTILFYAGDDTTDEGAFRAVKSLGIGVRIGASRSSQASYYLRSQREIRPLLERLVRL